MFKLESEFSELEFALNQLIFDTTLRKELDDYLPHGLIDRQLLLPNQFAYIMSCVDGKIHEVSDSCFRITGYEKDDIDLEWSLANIHPNDKSFVSSAIARALRYNVAGDKTNAGSGLFINYRFRHKNGAYIHLLRRSHVVKTDKQGRMIFHVSIFTDISDLKKESGISFEVFQGGTKVLNENKVQWLKKRSGLTSREAQVLDFLSDDCTSEEISEKLFISKHTVDTHRRSILKKLRIKNTRELVHTLL